MKKLLSLTMLALFFSMASYAIDPIIVLSSSSTVCLGSPKYVADSTFGGTWSSSDVTIATISSGGAITGVTAGTFVVSYTVGSSVATLAMTVAPSPAAISGATSVCVGSSITLTDATSGGTWSSFAADATAGASTGVITGVSSGTDYIYYTLPGGCYASYSITVGSAGTVDAIEGDSSMCASGTDVLYDPTSGGTWSTSSSSVTVSSGGLVTGVSAGVAIISYTATGTCGSATATYAIDVVAAPGAVSISGTTSVGIGGTTTLTGSLGAGTWTSSSTGVATVSGGVVTGVTAGTATITYTYTTPCGSSSATTVVTVNPYTGISGNVLFRSGTYIGAVKVWLITYTPSTHILAAVDSQVVFSYDTTAYYHFDTEPTDSYRVKADVVDSTVTTIGYLPTYHTSSFYWHDADVIYHVATAANTGNNIVMGYGTTTTGPGFIAGDVTTGADRGTSTGAPAAGMIVYLLNSTGTPIQYTYTNASGNYSFSNLPVGTSYTVFPEVLQYMTTAYPSISLTTGAASSTAANFIQHTISMTITPVTSTTGVKNVTATSSVVTFPNPTTGKLNIQWNLNATETGNVNVTDVTGRQVYSTSLNMLQGAGAQMLDLSNLSNGLYIVNIKSASVNYNNKIQIQH